MERWPMPPWVGQNCWPEVGQINWPLTQLYEWYHYNRITDRLYAAYILVCASVIAVISVWLFTEEFTPAVIGCIFICSVGVSGFVALQVFLAAQKIREILEQYGD